MIIRPRVRGQKSKVIEMSGKSLEVRGMGMGFHEAAGHGIELCGAPLNLIQPDKGNHTTAAGESPPHQPVSEGEGKVGSHEHQLLVIEGQRLPQRP